MINPINIMTDFHFGDLDVLTAGLEIAPFIHRATIWNACSDESWFLWVPEARKKLVSFILGMSATKDRVVLCGKNYKVNQGQRKRQRFSSVFAEPGLSIVRGVLISLLVWNCGVQKEKRCFAYGAFAHVLEIIDDPRCWIYAAAGLKFGEDFQSKILGRSVLADDITVTMNWISNYSSQLSRYRRGGDKPEPWTVLSRDGDSEQTMLLFY